MLHEHERMNRAVHRQWRLACLWCGRAQELRRLPGRRICKSCGGYLEAQLADLWAASAGSSI
jgi:hypothetical protein